MKLVYRGVTGDEQYCAEFYGMTSLNRGPERGLFLVFELASEGSIDEYLRCNGPNLTWGEVCELFNDVASGMRNLHSKGIAHGSAPIQVSIDK
jgi:serine/threonine protein kinase